MFKVDKTEMGLHLKDLILSSYESARQFGIEYLKKRDGMLDEDAIPNMSNRISQIIHGNKWIQMEDLPIFSELLGVSVEDIVSAGTSSPPSDTRVTNYSIAHSDDPSLWEAYIKRPDKLILNPDEYDKTVIDYALEAGNYPFMKYLVDNGFVWFVGDDKHEYYEGDDLVGAGFGAGTSIEHRTYVNIDPLNSRLKEKDDLRFRMISLAIRNCDTEMLTTLRAREIPLLYRVHRIVPMSHKEDRLPSSKNIDQFINHVASGSKEVLSYFFAPFSVESVYLEEMCKYMFPYTGIVLDRMIRQKKRNVVPYLTEVLRWNREIFNKLKSDIDENMETCRESYQHNSYDEPYINTLLRARALYYYFFYPETGILSYTNPRIERKSSGKGFITNVIHVSASSSDPVIQSLIDELNETYDYCIQLLKEKELKHV